MQLEHAWLQPKKIFILFGLFLITVVAYWFINNALEMLPEYVLESFQTLKWIFGVLSAFILIWGAIRKLQKPEESIDKYALGVAAFSMLSVIMGLPEKPESDDIDAIKKHVEGISSSLKELPALTSAHDRIMARMLATSKDEFELGYLHLAKTNIEQSIKHFDSALENSKEVAERRAEIHAFKSLSLYEQRDFDAALAEANKSIVLQPQQYFSYMNKSVYLKYLGRLDEALEVTGSLLKTHPEVVDVWFQNAHILQELGWYEEAISSYENANRLDDGYYRVWNNSGLAYAALGKSEDAILAYDRAISITDKNYQAFANKGNELLVLERYEEAIVALNYAIEKADGYYMVYDSHRAKADALVELGDTQSALVEYSKSIEIYPDSPFAYKGMGIAFTKVNKWREASIAFDRCLKAEQVKDSYKNLCAKLQEVTDSTATEIDKINNR